MKYENDKEMLAKIKEDITCLAEDAIFPADFAKTGLNLNEAVFGPTAAGKTTSISLPRGLHTYNSSIIIPLTKRKLKEQLIGVFQERGYKIIDFDLINIEDCQWGYDPLAYCENNDDCINLCRAVIGGKAADEQANGKYDPYWDNAGANVLSAVTLLLRCNEEQDGRKVTYADVIRLFKNINLSRDYNKLSTNIDFLFEEARKYETGKHASFLWDTLINNSRTTGSCIYSIANTAVGKMFTDSILALFDKPLIDIADIGETKTALFITTSPTDFVIQHYLNLFYADLFKVLFKTAEKNADYKLNVPVHLICDDFAVSTKINNFEKFISIFRAAGISVTLLLQSLPQLYEMYGKSGGTIILDNCDTQVFATTMNLETQQYISQQLNMSLDDVIKLGIDTFIVFRRGSKPIISKRYQVFDDPLYKEMVENDNKEGSDEYGK